MIGNTKLDEIEKPKRNRAIRRKNDYLKAKKFKDDMVSASCFPEYWEDMPLGRLSKNTSISGTSNEKGYRKTKNKGPNHDGTHAPTHNYSHSDKMRIDGMEEDLATYEEDVA